MSNRALQVVTLSTMAAMSSAAGATSAIPANTEQRSVAVQYRPADLNSGAGAENVFETLYRAARFACGDEGYSREISVRLSFQECERNAIANAVSGVSNANLTTAYNRHFPNEPLVEKERLSERLHALIILVVGEG
jgi:UrcA family protein